MVTAARIMGFAGLNITYPCKQAVVPLLDELSPQARAMGAVNTVVIREGRLVGHHTDGSGWAWGFHAMGCRSVDGGSMAVAAFELFAGLKADAARMERHFRRLIAWR